MSLLLIIGGGILAIPLAIFWILVVVGLDAWGKGAGK